MTQNKTPEITPEHMGREVMDILTENLYPQINKLRLLEAIMMSADMLEAFNQVDDGCTHGLRQIFDDLIDGYERAYNKIDALWPGNSAPEREVAHD